jgi:hypothetical protein
MYRTLLFTWEIIACMGNYYCLGCDRGMQSHCFLLAQVPICRKLLLTWEIIVYMGNYCCLGCPVSLRHPGSGISLHLLYRKLLFTWEIFITSLKCVPYIGYRDCDVLSHRITPAQRQDSGVHIRRTVATIISHVNNNNFLCK